jgi:DNA-3-methyladenine glycosylase II
MTGRIITSAACVAEGMAWLCQNDSVMADAYGQTGPLTIAPLKTMDLAR